MSESEQINTHEVRRHLAILNTWYERTAKTVLRLVDEVETLRAENADLRREATRLRNLLDGLLEGGAP